MLSEEDTLTELQLLATILERLVSSSPNGQVRNDQLDPLARRLRTAVSNLAANRQTLTPKTVKPLAEATHGDADDSQTLCHPGNDSVHQGKLRRMRPIANGAPAECDSAVRAAAPPTVPTGEGTLRGPGSRDIVRKGKLSKLRSTGETVRSIRTIKQSSVRALPIPREAPPTNRLLVSKEVARVFTCTLYNVLESTARSLEAASASIFIKVGDEMVSVANVAAKLSFPPKLNRHRCQDSIDAEVLGSGVAVNQRIHGPGAQSASILVFPVYAGGLRRTGRHHAVATVHVENKASGKKYFDAVDESFLFFAASIIGEIMTRVPIDWMDNFFDPATQHVVAPFELPRVSSLPLLSGPSVTAATVGTASSSGESTVGRRRSVEEKRAELGAKIDAFAEEVLVKRESVPHHLDKSAVSGLSVMPTLREVRNYMENVQDCWRRNVGSNVALMEDGREDQMELKAMRRELTMTQQRLATCEEQLRLYQLDGGDYKREYREMRKELDAYIQNRDDIIM